MISATLATLATWVVTRPASEDPAQPVRFAITSSPDQPLRVSPFERSLAISPNGRYFVFTSRGSGTGGPIMIRALDQLEPRPLPGVTNAREPSFSPDGASLVFFDGPALKKIAVAGGPAITLCTTVGGPRGASWDYDNTVVFATGDPKTGLWRVPSRGGEPIALTTPDAAAPERDHLFPSVLPNGRGVLFTIATLGQPGKTDVAVLDPITGQFKTLIVGGSQAQYADSGHLVYATAGALHAVRFDVETLQVVSDPIPIVDDLTVVPTGAAYYAVSRSGTLLYLPKAPETDSNRLLVWVDRNGREQVLGAPPRNYGIPRLSPDGTRIAVDIRDQEHDIWIWHIAQQTLRRLTYGPAFDLNPVWTPDNRRVIFSSNRDGPSSLYAQVADGTGAAERLTTGGNPQFATSITSDGASVAGYEDGPNTFDVVLFPVGSRPSNGTPLPSTPLIRTPSTEHNPEISPDGRYLAYQSNESGLFEVYVRPFPDVDGGRWQVSSGGGSRPAWSKNGRELFYSASDGNTLLAVAVGTSRSTFSWGNPVKLFEHRLSAYSVERAYDVSTDGRFLMVKGNSDDSPASLVVVLNWFEELKAKSYLNTRSSRVNGS